MKKLYKNINIPYHYYDNRLLLSGYIYNDKKYFDLNELFTDYLGSYLTYHFKINNELKEVHSLCDIVNVLFENYQGFSIPKVYIDEYSEDEYKFITRLHQDLLNNKLIKGKPLNRKMTFKDILKNPIQYLVNQEVKIYKNLSTLKKVYSKVLKRNIYVLDGNYYENFFDIAYYCCYYQFNGDGIETSYNHTHEHDFEDVIRELFETFDDFIIYDYQKQFFSKQELDFINKLIKKLKNDNYTSKYYKTNDEDKKLSEEYHYLHKNKKYFKLFIFKIKDNYRVKRYNKILINSHKTNKKSH